MNKNASLYVSSRISLSRNFLKESNVATTKQNENFKLRDIYILCTENNFEIDCAGEIKKKYIASCSRGKTLNPFLSFKVMVISL